ncbi:RNA polymerase sigma factor [bacterium]|nr:RNA polymerase sigma factor [bacterium]
MSEPYVSRRGGQAAGSAQGKQRGAAEGVQGEFLGLLMPLYPKALAYAQTITGSLMDGEDLVSDAVLNAYSRFSQLRDRGRFKEWFFAILLNRFRNLRSRSMLRPLTLVAEPSDHLYFWEATARVSGDPAELGYQLTLTKELLLRLNPREREAVLLLGPAGFSVDEVAKIQRTSRRAVIQRAYRARRKLNKLLPEGSHSYLGIPAAKVQENE